MAYISDDRGTADRTLVTELANYGFQAGSVIYLIVSFCSQQIK